MLDPLPRRYTVCFRLFLPRCHRPSPMERWVGFPRLFRLKRLRAGEIFEDADISLCSGLQVCSPPRSSLPLRILPQGSRGFYVRAERGSLPPRASDMLTARRQAIGGAGTCTPLDCGLVGCSLPSSSFHFFPFACAWRLAAAFFSAGDAVRELTRQDGLARRTSRSSQSVRAFLDA